MEGLGRKYRRCWSSSAGQSLSGWVCLLVFRCCLLVLLIAPQPYICCFSRVGILWFVNKFCKIFTRDSYKSSYLSFIFVLNVERFLVCFYFSMAFHETYECASHGFSNAFDFENISFNLPLWIFRLCSHRFRWLFAPFCFNICTYFWTYLYCFWGITRLYIPSKPILGLSAKPPKYISIMTPFFSIFYPCFLDTTIKHKIVLNILQISSQL